MKTLCIFKNGTTFSAGSSETADEMHGLTGDLFDLYSSAFDLLEYKDSDRVFEFAGLQFSNDDFQADWNEDLNGYVLTFTDGKQAQTQINKELNKLHADYNEEYLERYTEYDDELSAAQIESVSEFIAGINKLKYHYG